MSYTPTDWRNMQISAVDPLRWMNSNEIKKVTRGYTLGRDIVSGVNSFILEKTGDRELTVHPGHAVKQDIYIHFHEPVVLDLDDTLNYCVSGGDPIDEPGIYYVVLDYQYAKTEPAPYATIKIARTYEVATITQELQEVEDNYTRIVNRYLFLGCFSLVEDPVTGDKIIGDIYDHDPNHPDLKRENIDLFYAAGNIGNNNGSGILSCLPHEGNPVSNKIYVEAGVYANSSNTGIVKFQGGYTPEFPGTTEDGKFRYDLVTINDDKQLKIYSGTTEYDTAQDPYELEPPIPSGEYPIAIVEITGVNPLITDDRIFDARPFINNGSGGTGASSFKYQSRTNWDGTETVWHLPFQIDISKPHFIFIDRLKAEESDYTISGYDIIFNRPPQEFTEVYSFELVESGSHFVIPPIERTKSDWDGTETVWYLDFTPDINYPMAIFADSRHLEIGVDVTIENDNELHFVSPPVQYTAIIAHGSIIGPEIAYPNEEEIIAAENQTVFSISTFSYTPNTHDIEVYRNGLKLPPSKINELSATTFEILDENILENDVIVVRKIGLVPTHLYNMDISEVIGPVEEDIVVLNDGQTDIVFSTISYTIGQQQLEVYINGLKLSYNHYEEISGGAIRIDHGLNAGDVVTVRKLGISPNGTYSKVGSVISKKTKADLDSNGVLNLDFTYDVGQGQLEVYINNFRYFVDDDYTETSESSIQFAAELYNNITDNDVIRVIKHYMY